MLERLTIKNYALIDNLELDFDAGLTILTGETGAGKSIMLDALSLLQGGRADTRVIADGDSKSVVEALFSDVDQNLKSFFISNDLDWNDGDIIIRREISQNGRSRAFINDRPVTLTILAQLSEQLIDIHSQHANARLNDASAQLEVIDAMAANENLLADYVEEFAAYVNLRGKIRRLRQQIEKTRENSEFIRFQLEQLDKLNPRKGELAEIERKYEMLNDADEIKERLMRIAALTSGGEGGTLERLAQARALADRVDMQVFTADESSKNMSQRLEQIIIELKDINESIEDFASAIDSDPMALQKASARMNQYYELIKRFRVVDADALVDLRDDLKSKIQGLDAEDGLLPELEKESRTRAKVLKEKVDLVTVSRRKAADELVAMLNETARPLGLKNMNFTVFMETGKLTVQGQDHVEFRCAFNKNQQPGPLAKIASGGELSRLMLSLKRILADRMNLPTIIFDEVDTGVSGEIADKMGSMMQQMGNEMQVLTITHLPQVAAKGRNHYKVFKTDGDNRTTTGVRRLSDTERVQEIAAMMSGSEVTDAALDNARQLLKTLNKTN